MLQISHHAILRYAQRQMDMTELQSECLTQPQYDMIRNLLTNTFSYITAPKLVLNYDAWKCRIIIVDHTLVTITNY